MDLRDVQNHAARLGRIVFLASTRPDGRPHNAPVGVAWIDDAVCAFVMNPSVKVANLRANPAAHLHWQVSPETGNDSLVIDGQAEIIDTTEGRAALWDHMGYELEEFEPNGPSSNNHVFIKVTPHRAALLYRFGFDGRDTWQADESLIDLAEQNPQSVS